MESSKLSSLQPWLVKLRHKKSLQELTLLALGSTPERAKINVSKSFQRPDIWEFVDVMRIQSNKFVVTVQYAHPLKYQEFISIPRS